VITERSLRLMRPGDKQSQALHDAPGALLVRMTSKSAIEFFYRLRSGGKDDALKLGAHTSSAADGLSVREAFQRARAHAGRPAEAREARGTFEELLRAYVEKLQHAGKISAPDVGRSFKRAIPEHDPLRRKRAAAITPPDITGIVARRVRAGALVDANRLRSHLCAAFAFGLKADNDPAQAAQDAARYGLISNPAAVVARVNERPNGNGQAPIAPRVLTWAELGHYWRALDDEPEAVAATLRFTLAIGGQRIQQVLRAQWSDIEERNRECGMSVLRILDGKGRGQPRRHALPITPLAQAQLQNLGGGERPFPVDQFRLSAAIAAASKKLCAALDCEPFDQRALRRSVETRLADVGVSREVRANLLSHGRTGIQATHYDFAERLVEKRDALKLFEKHLRRAIAAR
jgi:integrase